MFDIGIWELLVIGVLALVVFGPDRLPKAIADFARLLRQVRAGAAAAKEELTVAAGLQPGGEMSAVMADLRDLDPRRVVDLPDLADLADPASPLPAGPASGTAQPGPAKDKKDPADRVDPDWL